MRFFNNHINTSTGNHKSLETTKRKSQQRTRNNNKKRKAQNIKTHESKYKTQQTGSVIQCKRQGEQIVRIT